MAGAALLPLRIAPNHPIPAPPFRINLNSRHASPASLPHPFYLLQSSFPPETLQAFSFIVILRKFSSLLFDIVDPSSHLPKASRDTNPDSSPHGPIILVIMASKAANKRVWTLQPLETSDTVLILLIVDARVQDHLREPATIHHRTSLGIQHSRVRSHPPPRKRYSY